MKSKIFLFLSLLIFFALPIAAQEKMKNDKTPIGRSKAEPLKVGEIAPDFTLSDQNGKQTTLSKAKMPVVLVFYRGYW